MSIAEQADDNIRLPLSKRIELDVESSIQLFSQTLRETPVEAQTHHAILVDGWNDNDASRNALAIYLVGLAVTAIDTALNIKAALLDEEDPGINVPEQVEKIVHGVVGVNNTSLTEDYKQDERNPWIAEGLWHLCMMVASRKTTIHPTGRVISVDYVHIRAKDHGLDGLALYISEQNGIGLSIIESKAYKTTPNQAISNAVSFFKEVDQDVHSQRILQKVAMMRAILPGDLQSQVTGMFWKRTRTYIPNPHYDRTIQMDWSNTRTSFRDLQVQKTNIIIMPHIIDDFDFFFNDVSDRMRNYARGLNQNV